MQDELVLVLRSPIGHVSAAHAFGDPIALAAGVGVGVSSSVIPYVFDQLAMARLPRSTYALCVALLPATATVVGVIVLRQLPSLTDAAGIALVIVGVGLHRSDAKAPPDSSCGRRSRLDDADAHNRAHGVTATMRRVRDQPGTAPAGALDATVPAMVQTESD